MRNLTIVCRLLLFFLASTPFSSSLAAKRGVTNERVGLPASVGQAARSAGIPVSALGIYVQEVGAKKPLLKLNELQAFNPASTMKLLTTDAALHLLGPSYRWNTQIYGRGSLQGEVWHGDLIFKGSLDPKLVLEDFWLMLRQLRSKGIRQIHGNLLLDRSIAPELANTANDAADFDQAAIKAYNVLPDALLLNYKSLRLQFRPDASQQLVHVSIEPALPSVQFGPLRLSNAACDEWRDDLAMQTRADAANMHLQFAGSYAASCGARTWDIHPYWMSADAYFAAVFQVLWRELGGSLKGEVKPGLAADDASLLMEWQSPPLAEVVRDINKFSNNVMARQLLLTLGSGDGKPASYARGAARIRQWLQDQGLAANELQIENGSGLSRNERIAARSMARILLAAYSSRIMPDLMASLPIVGVDGTMRNRLKQSQVAGQAHIKTGTLNDVRAVAGYVLAASGKRYVVVAFVNHGRAAESRAMLDQLIEWVYLRG